MTPKLPDDWETALSGELKKPYMAALWDFLKEEARTGQTVFPPAPQIFNALHQTPFHKVRVVILGQDPYHGPDQAHGLSFSVPAGIKLPPSLRNIYKEIERDFQKPAPKSGDLTGWAHQGVLLLNTTLTVRAGLAASHQRRGWEDFTDAVIKTLSSQRKHLVFLLWGSHAQKKSELIDQDSHLILEAPHPSPLSAHRGFLGCGHFSKTNDYLIDQGQAPIEWVKAA